MDNTNYIETWICLMREGIYRQLGSDALMLTEPSLHEMAVSMKLPMLIESSLGLSEHSRDLSLMTPIAITKVEVRRDSVGAYLAGLVKTPNISFAVRVADRCVSTGPLNRHPRIVSIGFVEGPLVPVEPLANPDGAPRAEAEP